MNARIGLWGTLLIVLGLGAGEVQGALELGVPDIYSEYIQVDYDPLLGSSQFTARGDARSLDFDRDVEGAYDIDISGCLTPSYEILADIDTSGVASTATLTIQGEIEALGATSGTLLEGTLRSFTWADPSGGFEYVEFTFWVSGGDLAGEFGDYVGVLLDINSSGSFTGDFTTEFHNFYSGYADNAPPVPEPAALPLLAGVVGVLARRRRA